MMEVEIIKAQDIRVGQWLTNIGEVEEIEHTPQFTAFTIVQKNLVLSAAFFWYKNDEQLIVENSRSRETSNKNFRTT